MKIYLAGPIAGCTDNQVHGWRAYVTKQLNGAVINPAVRDARGKSLSSQDIIALVEADVMDIDASTAVLAHCWKPTVGTSMEIVYAWQMGKPVYAIVPHGVAVSPWLRHHARIFGTVDYALDAINADDLLR